MERAVTHEEFIDVLKKQLFVWKMSYARLGLGPRMAVEATARTEARARRTIDAAVLERARTIVDSERYGVPSNEEET
jgi:hypothetical protein